MHKLVSTEKKKGKKGNDNGIEAMCLRVGASPGHEREKREIRLYRWGGFLKTLLPAQ